MYPAKPPLPMPRKSWFQPVRGIQTSILMAESLAGASVACTRQNAGRFFANRLAPGSDAPPGGTKAPAAICCAEVIVVPGSLSVARVSQLAAKARPEPVAKAMKATAIRTGLILRSTLGIGIPQTRRQNGITFGSLTFVTFRPR